LIARDLTGSGKTFAFGLPMVEYLRRHRHLGSRRVQAICLAPTRELAIQVTNEIAKLKHYENEFRLVTVYGGVNIEEQIRQLRNGVISSLELLVESWTTWKEETSISQI